MPALVIDGLETVKVCESESHSMLFTPRDLDLVCTQRHESTTVVQAGQFISL
jgi:hypothetical protein